MVRARKLEKRRKAIQNIQKITRTMELIATARFKKAWTRVQSVSEYVSGLLEILEVMGQVGSLSAQPLWHAPEPANRVLLLVLSSNRGLCGGYNAAVVRQTMERFQQLQAERCEVILEVSGKRGASALRFRHVPIQTVHTHLADRPQWEAVEVLAQRYLGQFQAGQWDRLEVVYTASETAGRWRLKTEMLLPLAKPKPAEENIFALDADAWDLYPSAEEILEQLSVRLFKAQLFRCFLHAALSEQIARMFAMKTATENTEKMLHRLALAHHRARQTQITSEILEVLSGAEALQQQK